MKASLMDHLLQQSIDGAQSSEAAANAALIVQLIRRSIEQNDRILEEHADMKAALTNHALNEDNLVKGLLRAFPSKPDGTPDFEGHEAFHTALIEESRARTVFYRDLRQELIKKGLWGLVLILSALVAYWWTGQLRGLH
jgi:hypothetical protein